MKHTLLSYLFGIVCFIILTAQSCDTTSCKNVVCENGGECLEGTCYCEVGFSGKNCENEQRLAFLGNFDATEECSGNPELIDVYEMAIVSVPSLKNKFLIENIFGLDRPQFDPTGNPIVDLTRAEATVIATVSTDNSFNIEEQTLSGRASNLKVTGSGTIAEDSTITISYILTNSDIPLGSLDRDTDCTTTLTFK